MKSFLIACAVFALAATAVLILSAHTGNEARELARMCTALPDDTKSGAEEFGTAYDELYNKWKSFSAVLQLTVNHSEEDSITLDLAELKEYYLAGDTSGYRALKARLTETFTDLGETEGLSMAGIF